MNANEIVLYAALIALPLLGFANGVAVGMHYERRKQLSKKIKSKGE